MGVISECLVVFLVCQAICLLTAQEHEEVDTAVPHGDVDVFKKAFGCPESEIGKKPKPRFGYKSCYCRMNLEELGGTWSCTNKPVKDEPVDQLALPETGANTEEELAALQFANTFEKRGKGGKNGKGKGGKGSSGRCTKPRPRRGRNAAAMNPMYLEWHNYYRCLHGVDGLTYSSKLEVAAKRNVQNNVRSQEMEHTSNNKFGENLWAAWGSGGYGLSQITGQDPVKAWYDEINSYDFNSPTGFSGATGHFTQVVWRDTRKLGCWTAEHPMRGGMTRVFVACEYDPPGNMNLPRRINKQNWLDQVPRPR